MGLQLRNFRRWGGCLRKTSHFSPTLLDAFIYIRQNYKNGLCGCQNYVVLVQKALVVHSWSKSGSFLVVLVTGGCSVMKRVMGSQRVLLVFNGVDHLEQLEGLAGSRCWFGAGSLVVVTGKDRQLLVAHGVEKIYDVDVLNDDESMELFCLYAFRRKDPEEEFRSLCERVVRYVKGHPLALKVLGSFLFGKTVDVWKSELDQFQRYPIDDIQVLISRCSSKKK